jgi:hypothetical protein
MDPQLSQVVSFKRKLKANGITTTIFMLNKNNNYINKISTPLPTIPQIKVLIVIILISKIFKILIGFEIHQILLKIL